MLNLTDGDNMTEKKTLTIKQRQLLTNYVKYVDHFGPMYDTIQQSPFDAAKRAPAEKFIDNCQAMLAHAELELIDSGNDYLPEWSVTRQYCQAALDGNGYWFRPDQIVKSTNDKTLFDDISYDDQGGLVIA